MAREVVSSYLELGGEEHAERDPDHPAHHCHKPEDERNPANTTIYYEVWIGVCVDLDYLQHFADSWSASTGPVDTDSQPYPTSLTFCKFKLHLV